MGNVLMNYDPEVSLNRFCTSEEEKTIIRRELFEGPEWEMGDLGQIADRERYVYVKKRIQERYWPSLKQCCDNWDICMTPLQGAKEFCDSLKKSGYRIYVLSNASDKFYEYFPGFAPLAYFDGIVVSADIHMVKPDIRIYRYILERFGLQADECLFIDDRQENVDGAAHAGMHSAVFQNDFEEIRKRYQLRNC